MVGSPYQPGQLFSIQTLAHPAGSTRSRRDNHNMRKRCIRQSEHVRALLVPAKRSIFFIIYMLAKVDNWLPCFTKIINSLMTTWSMIEQSFPSCYSSAKRAIKSETLKILKSESLDRSYEMGNRWKGFEAENRGRKSFESRPTAQCGHFLFSS